MSYKLLAFDLDDTLAVSKSAITPEMGEILVKILEKYEICIITGGLFAQIKKQVIDKLPIHDEKLLTKIHPMPTCGTKYLKYDIKKHDWSMVYAKSIPEPEKNRIIDILEQTARKTGLWQEKTFGPAIEDRDSQITYSILGQQAPPEKKYEFKEKYNDLRLLTREKVAELLPDYAVNIGGATSIDIAFPGIDKAYGLEQLLKQTGLNKKEVLFFGDAIYPGGNDYSPLEAGFDVEKVKDQHETLAILKKMLTR
jgi:HAD superfamily hydrolase (TIGR01484 family)